MAFIISTTFVTCFRSDDVSVVWPVDETVDETVASSIFINTSSAALVEADLAKAFHH